MLSYSLHKPFKTEVSTIVWPLKLKPKKKAPKLVNIDIKVIFQIFSLSITTIARAFISHIVLCLCPHTSHAKVEKQIRNPFLKGYNFLIRRELECILKIVHTILITRRRFSRPWRWTISFILSAKFPDDAHYKRSSDTMLCANQTINTCTWCSVK